MYKKRFPQFELNCRKYYASLLNPAFESIRSTLKKQIELDSPEEIAISLDGWSQYHSSYLGINGHYIDKDFKRKIVN